MKKFFKHTAIIILVFVADFLTKAGILSFLYAKYGDMVYNPNIVCAKCHIEGIFIPWKYIIGGDWGISNLFNIQFVWNRGVSFSAFNNVMPVIISCITAIIIAYLMFYLFKKYYNLFAYCLLYFLNILQIIIWHILQILLVHYFLLLCLFL